MITILHGDDIVVSRNKLIENKRIAREEGKEVFTLEGKEAGLSMLVQSLESHSLFGGMKLVVIENLLSNLRAGKARDEIIDYLVAGKFDADMILWEGKSVGRQLLKLKKQKHINVAEFKMPVTIFKFVDSIMPGNQQTTLSALDESLITTVPEVVFTMLVRQFRLLIALTYGADIDETKRLAPWQRGKLKRQASAFTEEKLKNAYKELLLIDYQTKTGKSALNLTKRMQQFIIELSEV
ncbi:hypothetical protein HY468_05135 [Candidatus Roizmanbacteria bacterium]|nr:hypothetical protein [Candidatus Roizmanbacteria bacterium]